MPTTIKADSEGAVGIGGRKAIAELSRDVLFELGFEGSTGVQ